MKGIKGKIDKRREMGTTKNDMLNNTQMLLKNREQKCIKSAVKQQARWWDRERSDTSLRAEKAPYQIGIVKLGVLWEGDRECKGSAKQGNFPQLVLFEYYQQTSYSYLTD